MKRPKLGQRVVIAEYVELDRMQSGQRPYLTYWGKPFYVKPVSLEGVYVGYRTLRNGSVIYNGPEEGNEFCCTDVFEAWLVVIHERENHIRVLPEDVEFTGKAPGEPSKASPENP